MMTIKQRKELGWPRNLLVKVFESNIPERIIRDDAEEIIDLTLSKEPFRDCEKRLIYGAFKDCKNGTENAVANGISKGYGQDMLRAAIYKLRRPGRKLAEKVLIIPLEEALANPEGIEQEYVVTLTQYGTFVVKATSSAKAMEMANNQNTEDINWSTDWSATDANLLEEK